MNFLSFLSIKVTITLFLNFCIIIALQGQVTIGSGNSPESYSCLQLDESKGGLRLNQLTTADRDLLSVNNNPLADGLIIFNKDNQSIEMWNGYRWVKLPISASNGLTLNNDNIKLGGVLQEPTTLQLNTNILNFMTTTGAIGVNEVAPKSALHINSDEDPLILNSVKYVTEDVNSGVDDANSIYYDLKISTGGVIRKVLPVSTNPNQSSFYNLSVGLPIPNGTANGNLSGAITDPYLRFMTWRKAGMSEDSQSISLPEDGAYVFSFRLYGPLSDTESINGTSNSFYISAFKNTTGIETEANYQLFDIAEIVLVKGSKLVSTYSVNLSVSGKYGDKVRFRISRLSTGSLSWSLTAIATGIVANRTSMIFWKL